MKLSIIIVNYNNPHLIEKCLETILRSSISFSYEILVVDNASKDFPNLAKFKNSPIHVIKNKENLGFGKANNQAVEKARGEFLLFLNTDTEVIDNAIDKLVKFSEAKKNSIIGAKLFNPDGSKQPSCGPFYSLPVAFTMLFLKGDQLHITRYSPNSIKEVDWVSGACLLMKKEDFTSVGGFDEEIFMYMDEIDLCFRARKSGMKVLFFPDAQFIHVGAATSTNSHEPIINIYKGLLYFYKKHGNLVQYKVITVLLRIKAYIAVLLGIAANNKQLTSVYRKALSDL